MITQNPVEALDKIKARHDQYCEPVDELFAVIRSALTSIVAIDDRSGNDPMADASLYDVGEDVIKLTHQNMDHPALQGWFATDCPSEIVVHLLDKYDDQAARISELQQNEWRPITEHDGSDDIVEVYRDGDHFFASCQPGRTVDGLIIDEPYWDGDVEYGGRPIEPPPSHFRKLNSPRNAAKAGK